MQRQAVPLESLRQHVHHTARVFLVLEEHHGVVGVARQVRPTAQARTDLLFKPHVQHRVQVDVREQGGDDSSLRRAGSAALQLAVLHHSCAKPLADEAPDHPVAYPLAKHFLQLPVVDRLEVLSDVDLDRPAAGLLDRLFA